MVKRRRKLRHRGSNVAHKRSKTRKKRSFKERFYTSAIWALGLINVVLIASKVSEFFVAPNETTISANATPQSDPPLLATNDPTTIVVPVEKPITVEVLNACGVKGLANKFTDYLRNHGFDVVNVGNYKGGFKLRRTTVIDRVSLNNENAVRVGAALGVDDKQIQPQLDDSPKLRVTVLLGRDYKKLKSFRELQ